MMLMLNIPLPGSRRGLRGKTTMYFSREAISTRQVAEYVESYTAVVVRQPCCAEHVQLKYIALTELDVKTLPTKRDRTVVFSWFVLKIIPSTTVARDDCLPSVLSSRNVFSSAPWLPNRVPSSPSCHSALIAFILSEKR